MSDAAESDKLQDPLEPALEKVEAELAKRLDEACDVGTEQVTQGSLDELLHLEEDLLAAARAADEAVRLRRRLKERGSADAADTRVDRSDSITPLLTEPGGRVREFRDRHRRAWRVWEVRPGLGRPLTQIHRYLGDYINGWLAFSYLDNDVRKRLPAFPPDWPQMSDREIEALLYQAVDVPKRAGSG